MNEGDPISLAQPAYMESLLEAYATSSTPTQSEWAVPRDLLYRSSGCQILLRDEAEDDTDEEDPSAFLVEDIDSRSVIFGNPLRHSMTLYLERVETICSRVAEDSHLQS